MCNINEIVQFQFVSVYLRCFIYRVKFHHFDIIVYVIFLDWIRDRWKLLFSFTPELLRCHDVQIVVVFVFSCVCIMYFVVFVCVTTSYWCCSYFLMFFEFDLWNDDLQFVCKLSFGYIKVVFYVVQCICMFCILN